MANQKGQDIWRIASWREGGGLPPAILKKVQFVLNIKHALFDAILQTTGLRSSLFHHFYVDLLQTHPPLQSRPCNRPILPSKGLKILNVPIHLHTKKHFAAETGDLNLCVRPIPKYDFQRQSFTNKVTQC